MSRLTLGFVLVFVASASLPPDGDTLKNYVEKLNYRAKTLYNARLWNQMITELYSEDATLSVPQYNMKGKGREKIKELLQQTSYGKIYSQQVVMAWTVGSVIHARVIMDFRMLTHPKYKPGTIIRWNFDETIVNGKFVFMEKDTGKENGAVIVE